MLVNTAEKPLVNSWTDMPWLSENGVNKSQISYKSFILKREFMAKASNMGKNLASIVSVGCDTFRAQTVEPICFRVGNMLFGLMKYPCADHNRRPTFRCLLKLCRTFDALTQLEENRKPCVIQTSSDTITALCHSCRSRNRKIE